MFTSLRGRIIVIIALVGASLGYLFTNGIKLGLDLQGGMHLVLEVNDPEGTMTSEARADAIDRAERILRTRIDEFGVEEPLVQKAGSDRIIVELPGIGLDDESPGQGPHPAVCLPRVQARASGQGAGGGPQPDRPPDCRGVGRGLHSCARPV